MRRWSHDNESEEVFTRSSAASGEAGVEHRGEHESQWAAIESIAAKIGCTAETLRGWVRQHERDSGQREGATSADKERIKALECENRELLAKSTRFCARRLHILPRLQHRPPLQAMKAFIDANRHLHGVEPICKALPIAPSTYYAHAASKADPERRSQRAKTDAALLPQVQRVWDENFEVYGVRKVWQQMRREDFAVARCTVQRLMKRLGLLRRHPRQGGAHDAERPEGTMSARSRESAIHRRSAECAVGKRFHVDTVGELQDDDSGCKLGRRA